MMKEICSIFAIDPHKVGIWSSGVNTELFDPRNYISENMRLKRKLGLSGKFVVFYHGAFTATRGLEETIESMKILSHEYSNMAMLLLGTGPIVFKLKQLVQEGGLQDRVIVHDPVEYKEVPKFIDMSDVCIIPLPDHPYWISQRPLKLLEYLAMEKVVVVTDIYANRSVISNAKCGIYMPSITPNEIAKSIMYAYINKDKLAEWGKTGRSIVEEKYTWEKIAEDFDNYLLSIDETVARGPIRTEEEKSIA